MNIVVPLDRYNEVEPLIRAGASEFYAGLFLEKDATGARPVKKCNFLAVQEFEEALAFSQEKSVDIALCCNFVYDDERNKRLLPTVKQLVDKGLRKIIVCNLGLLLSWKKIFPGVSFIWSTVGGCFNSRSAQVYKDAGAERIIFPRQMVVNEMAEVVRACPGIECEALGLNITCDYINAFCRLHWLFKLYPVENTRYLLGLRRFYLGQHMSTSFCKSEYRMKLYDGGQSPAQTDVCFGDTRMKCGVCSIPLLKRAGVKYFKIVGRGFPLEKKIKDVRFVRKVVEAGIDDKSLIRAAFNECYGEECLSGPQCHAPYFF